MTPANRQLNATEALLWSQRFVQAADQLASVGLHDRALSQLYYAVFHATRALLFTQGLEPRSHRGLRALFRDHFVRTGEFASDDSLFLDRLAQEREDADYLVSYRVDAAEYARWREQAAGYLDRVRGRIEPPPPAAR